MNCLRNFISLILITLIISGVKSQSIVIKVEDIRRNGLENAFLFCQCDDLATKGYSNPKGEFIMDKCKAKIFSISIKILGYEPIDTSFQSNIDRDTFILTLNETSYELSDVVFTAPTSTQSNKLGFNSKDFLRIAGSFDDPTRLLNKQASFVSTNDQNNAISFRGMPTKFNKWQVNGMEVISPNHLSNAGTRDDVNSPNAGGTNMISGQLIKSYQYIKPENIGSIPNQLSGTSNINTKAGLKPYAQASLIGLESGTGFTHNKTTLDVNYRYSFTGLLSNLGASFGGEEIKFQDFYASLSTEIKGVELQFLSLFGSSSNDYQAPDTVTFQKELTDINFKSDNRIFGFNGEKIMKNWVLIFGSYYSDKVFDRKATFLSQVLESEVSEFQSKLSNSIKISRNKFTFGFNHILDKGELSVSKIDTVSFLCICKNLNLKQSIFDIYVNRKYDFGRNWLIDLTFSYRPYANLPEDFSSIYPKIIIEKLFSSNTKINLSMGRNSQNVHDSKKFYQIDGNYAVLHLASKNRQNSISLEAFYHDALNFANIFDEGTNYFGELHPYELNGRKGRSYGLSLAHQYNSELFWAASNASMFNSESQITTDLKYSPTLSDYNYTFSLQAGKNFKLGDNTIAISLSQIARDGQLSTLSLPRLNSTELYRAKEFLRLDARVTYSRKKSILSLDVQNLLNRQNETYQYFDSVQMKNLFANQLGLIPVLSYRYFFYDKPINI